MNSTVLPRVRRSLVLVVTFVLLFLGAQMFVGSAAHADPNPEYDSIPAVYPPSFASLGYQATSTTEFGDHIELGGTDRVLDSVTVGLTNWACQSDYTLSGNVWTATGLPCTSASGSSFTHPIRVNIYAVNTAGPTPALGALLATRTENVTVPFRPSANPGVGAGLCGAAATQWYNPGTGTCHNGFGFNATFDFSALGPILPDEVIIAVAYNTQTYGPSPLGAAGPYNSLNVSLANDPPSVGSDVDADAMFWNTSFAGFYADGGAGGTGTLRVDTGWDDYDGLVLAVNSTAAIDSPTLALPGSVTPAGTLPATGVGTAGPAGWIGGIALLVAGGCLVAARAARLAHRSRLGL